MTKFNVIVSDSADELVQKGMWVKHGQDPSEIISSLTYSFPKIGEATIWLNKSLGNGYYLLNVMVQEIAMNVEEGDTEEEIRNRVHDVLEQWKDICKEHNLSIDF